MRPGQYNNNNNNKNRNNRNRNRRPGGGGGGQTGGSGANRVYDSNGPDVKLRGTAQTIAEKYMQLARDAQSSGDTVAAESYFQFADHYYRVWLAAQPVGQPIQFSRRNAEDEYDEDGNEIVAEAEGDAQPQEGGESSDNVSAEGGEGQAEGDQQPQQNRQNNRNDRYNNNPNQNQNREGGNNRNFRQRWPRRNDRYNQDGQPNGNQVEGQNEGGERQERFERPVEDVVVAQPREAEAQDAGNWEAPSFLTRPTPVVVSEPEHASEDAPAPRPRGRKPRAVAPVEDAPQGD
jgi:Domain of unknown function (DUF4167)